ncbi:hypothetical protein SAMN04488542_11647 [Fontibacillus panacisegetis]|uniref:Uncharacterized protein n=1 Tax=Fontibacillus panacisegetis TaxID=670482 RepID=A0A1G7NLS0_9BACL|nr:hypothetical protein SAMN04488542_11647 [Fontibacillus panacisegetis]
MAFGHLFYVLQALKSSNLDSFIYLILIDEVGTLSYNILFMTDIIGDVEY